MITLNDSLPSVPQIEKWRQEEKEKKKKDKEKDKEKRGTLRRMPGVKRKERGKTQPVRFEVPQEPKAEAKGMILI